MGCTLVFQRKEIQQHLDTEAVPQVGQIEALFAGLVVHHTQIQLLVMDPAVHTVHLTADREGRVSLTNGDGRQFTAAAKTQFEGHGAEIRVGQFVGNIFDHGPCRPAQTGEEIAKARIFLLIVVDAFLRVAVHIVPHQLPQFLLVHSAVATPFHYITGHILQQIVDKRADFRCFKPSGAPRLGLESVLHEVAKMAALELVHSGSGHADGPPVERPHRIVGKSPPLHGAATLHGLQRRIVKAAALQILPQFAAGRFTRQFQRRSRHLIAMLAGFLLHMAIGEQAHHTLHHKGGTQRRSIQIGGRPADPQQFRRLCQSCVNMLQFLIQWIKCSVGEQNIPLLQRHTVAFVQ